MSHMKNPPNHRKKLMDEVLTPKQRIQRKILMKKLGPKMAKKRAIAMKKKAPTEVIQKRAMKKAREILTKKILNNKSRNELGMGELEQLDKKLDKKKAAIKKIAKKMLPALKQAEKDRIEKLRSSK